MCVENRIRALLAYEERIAIAVRSGALLAACSINRESLQQYTRHLTHIQTNSLCRVSVARTSSCVHGINHNSNHRHVVVQVVNDNEFCNRYFVAGMNQPYSQETFGLDICCTTYGT